MPKREESSRVSILVGGKLVSFKAEVASESDSHLQIQSGTLPSLG